MAFNHRGISSGDRELFAFSIAPHFYETRTFIGVGAASILLLHLACVNCASNASALSSVWNKRPRWAANASALLKTCTTISARA